MKNSIKIVARIATLLPLVALTLIGCGTPPNPNVYPQIKPGLIQAGIPVEIIQEPVTVVSFDADRRSLTLEHTDGSRKTFNVLMSVKNFDQVKVGDVIKAAVKAEMAVYVLQNGRLPNPDGTTRPKTINFNAKVLTADPSDRLLILQFSNNRTMTIKAGQDVLLEKMSPGNDVVIRSHEITAITFKKSRAHD